MRYWEVISTMRKVLVEVQAFNQHSTAPSQLFQSYKQIFIERQMDFLNKEGIRSTFNLVCSDLAQG